MPGSCWASTSLGLCTDEDVDGRDKPGHNVLEWSASSLPFSVHPRASGDPAKRAASEIKQAWVPACAGTNGCKTLRAHRRSVMRGLGLDIHVFGALHGMKTWMAGTQACESTPSFGRLCPAMTSAGAVGSTASGPQQS